MVTDAVDSVAEIIDAETNVEIPGTPISFKIPNKVIITVAAAALAITAIVLYFDWKKSRKPEIVVQKKPCNCNENYVPAPFVSQGGVQDRFMMQQPPYRPNPSPAQNYDFGDAGGPLVE